MAEEGERGATRAWVAGLIIVTVVAGILRLYMPGPTILTVDELNWQSRSNRWEAALEARDYGSMVAAESGRPATRPGVTTMWTGYLSKKLVDVGAPGFSGVDRLRAGHQLMAIWCTLLLVPFMVVAARVVTRRGALVAGGILSVEPLLVGHSALLHTDALVTMTGAVATVGLVATFEEVRRNTGRTSTPRRWWTRPETRLGVVTGAASALAVLTKVSALVALGGAVVAAIGVHCWLVMRSRGSLRELARSFLPAVALPAGVALVLTVALWPALWVSPVSAVSDALSSFGLADQATPRLFLGEVVRGGDWRYYGVELVFRTSVWLLLAVPLAVGWVIWRRQSGRPPVMSRRNAAVLAGSGVLYTVGIVTATKQYGRYLLPLLPLAALALGAVAEDLVRAIHQRRHQRHHRRVPDLVIPSLGIAALAASAAFTLSLAPHQIAHVNPLVGGQQVAERVIHLGWGEGKEVVLERYRAHGECVAWAGTGSWLTGCRGERVDFEFVDGGAPPPTYVLRYVFDRQLGREPAGLSDYLRANARLVEQVEIDGVIYAEMWMIESSEGPADDALEDGA